MPKDRWDKAAIVATIATPLLIAGVSGGFLLFWQMGVERERADAELTTQLIPYLASESEKEREYARAVLRGRQSKVAVAVTCVDAVVTATVALGLQPPSKKVDGSDLTIDQITGYRVSYGWESGDYADSIDVGVSPGQTKLQFELPIDHDGAMTQHEDLFLSVQTISRGGISNPSPEIVHPLPQLKLECTK